jgi:hypothetical protein
MWRQWRFTMSQPGWKAMRVNRIAKMECYTTCLKCWLEETDKGEWWYFFNSVCVIDLPLTHEKTKQTHNMEKACPIIFVIYIYSASLSLTCDKFCVGWKGILPTLKLPITYLNLKIKDQWQQSGLNVASLYDLHDCLVRSTHDPNYCFCKKLKLWKHNCHYDSIAARGKSWANFWNLHTYIC